MRLERCICLKKNKGPPSPSTWLRSPDICKRCTRLTLRDGGPGRRNMAPLWSLFDCSFHISSGATCAHAGCLTAGRRRRPGCENKEQVWRGRGASLCNEWLSERLSSSSLRKRDSGEWQRSRQSSRPRPPLRNLLWRRRAEWRAHKTAFLIFLFFGLC